MHERTGMIKTDPQAIDYPYPATNAALVTTHHALIVCGALRRVCRCDDDRDAKEDVSDQFSRKQSRNATNKSEHVTSHGTS